MRNSRFIPAALVLACALIASRSRAAISYRWTTDQPSYSVVIGQRVPVAIFLEETVTAPDTSAIVAGNGLITAGLRLLPLQVPSDPAALLSRADILVDPGFTSSIESDPLDRLLAIDFPSAPGPVGLEVPPGSGVRRIHVATFTFTAGDVADETTTFRIIDYDPSTTDTLTHTGPVPPDQRPLDGLIQPTEFSIVTAVPEPASAALATLLGLFLLNSRRR